MVYSLVDTMSQTYVNIKGTSDGLVVFLGAGDWNTLLSALVDRLEQTPSFFRGGRVALHVGPRQLTQAQIERVGGLLKHYQISLWAVLSESEETRRIATEIGLETALAAPLAAQLAGESVPDQVEPASPTEDAILVRRILRSGQKIHHQGHVVLIGDLNPGAEVSATGDVLVWGRLRGTVHAGSAGDDKAIVCALTLSPMLLRIGPFMARSPGEGNHSEADPIVPEVAFVHNGQIVAEPWRDTEEMFGDWRSDLIRRATNTLSTWF